MLRPRAHIYLTLAASLLLTVTSGKTRAYAAAPGFSFTVNMSEAVLVTGTPRIALNIDGNTRYALYTSGSGSTSLTFTYTATPGDLDLDGIGMTGALDLNSGTVTDLNGNPLQGADLNFTVPDTSGIHVSYPALSMDFTAGTQGRYTYNDTAYTGASAFTSFLSAAGGSFSRPSTATYFDSTGTMQIAGNNTARFTHDPVTHATKGILLEQSRQNSIRNGQITGAVTGSPGTVPTYWSLGGTLGLTRQVVATGTINGMQYVDMRYSGTATATGELSIDPEQTQYLTGTIGQVWTYSSYFALISGTLTNTVNMNIRERDSTGTYLAQSSRNLKPLVTDSTLTRYTVTRTLSDPSMVYVQPALRFPVTTGDVVDFTLRIAAPQLEQGAFATSYIPTSGTPATRSSDSLIFTGLSSTLASHTASVQYEQTYGATSSYYPGILSADIGDSTARVYMYRDNSYTGSVSLNVRSAGNNASVTGTGYNLAAGKGAWAYQPSAVRLAQGGTYRGQVTSNVPTGLSRLLIGNGDTIINGTIGNVTIYPAAATNSQLQLLTQ